MCVTYMLYTLHKLIITFDPKQTHTHKPYKNIFIFNLTTEQKKLNKNMNLIAYAKTFWFRFYSCVLYRLKSTAGNKYHIEKC